MATHWRTTLAISGLERMMPRATQAEKSAAAASTDEFMLFSRNPGSADTTIQEGFSVK